MLPEMHIIEEEILPRLRERAPIQRGKVARQLAHWKGEKGNCSLFLSLKPSDVPKYALLPNYDLEEIHGDIEKMFVSQLKGALLTAFADGDAVPSVRANVGCGCINTLLGGVKQTYFPDKMPWLLEHLTDREIMELTKDDIAESEEFSRGLEEMRFMKTMLEGTGIEVYPMDLQGPIDMAHLWLGNEFFYLLYDDPDVIHHALSLSVECLDYALKKNLEIIRPADHLAHYNCLVLPMDRPVKLSEDTSTLISKEHLDEYMVPYTSEIFRRYGGGYIHYCGDNRHLLAITETLPGSIGLNFGNPERHDFSEIFPVLGKNGKSYIATASQPYSLEEQVKAAAREDGTFNLFTALQVSKADQARVLEEFSGYIEKYRVK
ncbi:MAG: hypothetical protein MJ141_08500 [Clostridia bacterium]|nr:hypothetical protein [Clostridia bacterium]